MDKTIVEARGRPAIQAALAKTLAGMQGARMDLVESHQMVAGDVIIGWGLWRATIPQPEGQSIEVTGRYTDVKAERNGKWVYLVDQASVPMGPPEE